MRALSIPTWARPNNVVYYELFGASLAGVEAMQA